MSKKFDDYKTFTSLHGLIVAADYHPDPDFPEFAGNPLIETLPPMYASEDEIEDMLQILAPYNPKDRELPPLKRIMKLGNLRHFYQPLERAVALALNFDDMLRWGYQERNPKDPAYIRRIHKGFTDFDVDNYDPTGTTPVGIVLIGYGGGGKTVTLNRILLKRYPQVYVHSNYQGKNFSPNHIVWIKLDCPEGGTRKDLIISLCLAIDALCGTNYFETIADRGAANIFAMMPQIANVLVNHFVGCLVIDEFQNFYGSTEGALTIKFLRRINNVLGIPLVFVGTPDASAVLAGQFSLTRRASAYGNAEWRQLKRGKLPDAPGDWDVFFAAASSYDYNTGTMTEDVSPVLHKTTGGIPDLGIKVLIAARKRAIRGNMGTGKVEDVDGKLIKRVVQEEFPWIKEAVDALNLGTPEALRRFHDLYFRNTREHGPKQQPETPNAVSQPPANKSVAEQPNSAESNPQAKPDLKRKQGRPSSTKTRAQMPTNHPALPRALTDIVNEGKKQQPPLSAYQSLLDAGYIVNPSDYF